MSIHNTVLFAAFDPRPFQDPESNFYNITQTNETVGINTGASTITFSISSGLSAGNDDKFRFSTNGVLGLGAPTSAFDIPQINYVNQDIYFYATLTSKESLSSIPRKNFDKIQQLTNLLITHNPTEETFIIDSDGDNFITDLTELQVNLVLDDGTVVPESSAKFTNNFSELSASYAGGYTKGKFNSSISATNCKLQIIYSTDDGLYLSGFSPTFNIYPNEGLFDIRKIGEDYNQKQAYKDLIYQEILNDQTNFFDNFLGQIVGDNTSHPDTLGQKIHSKIKNFVSNTNDIEYTDLNSLKSLINELDIKYELYQQDFPPSLNRILDIISVSLSLQKGGKNQFQENFDDRGFTGKTVYGTNKGFKLNINDAILETGDNSENIIAHERFSNQFKLVNTNVISATNVDYISASPLPGISAYPLSAFNSSWGWGLVVPNNVDGIAIKDYYDFYQYIPGIEGSNLQKFIDFDNPLNTYLEPISSNYAWEGKFKTNNPPGGPTWQFNGEDTFINLKGSAGANSNFYFDRNDWYLEMNLDLTPPVTGTELSTYDKAIIGQWSIPALGTATPTEPDGNTFDRSWLLLQDATGEKLKFQFASAGEDMTGSYEFAIDESDRRLSRIVISKFTTNDVLSTASLSCTINGREASVVGGIGGDLSARASYQMFPSNMPVYVGGESVTDPNRKTYRFSGDIEALQITLDPFARTGPIYVNSAITSTSIPLTSYTQFSEKYGIAENVIAHNLYSNLGLLSGS